MPYVFVDDGYPESGEFDNNYVWFDPEDPQALRRLEALLPAAQRRPRELRPMKEVPANGQGASRTR